MDGDVIADISIRRPFTFDDSHAGRYREIWTYYSRSHVATQAGHKHNSYMSNRSAPRSPEPHFTLPGSIPMPFRICRIILMVAIVLSIAPSVQGASRPNVLFIAIDDLRPELGCYGATHIHSPNIYAFAATALRFDRAYCQQAVCNPSRTSLMTGMMPDTIGITGNPAHFRTKHPNVVTLPQYFKRHGYHAAAIGKIYHGVFPEGSSITTWNTMGDPQSWSEPAVRFGPRYYYTEAGITAAKRVYEQIYKPVNPGPDDWTKQLVFGPARFAVPNCTTTEMA